jgi:hypothetical protein
VEFRSSISICPSKGGLTPSRCRGCAKTVANCPNNEGSVLPALQQASIRPVWSNDHAPMVYSTLQALVAELDTVRLSVPNLDQLISGRKTMLQASNLDAPLMSNDHGSSPTQPLYWSKHFKSVLHATFRREGAHVGHLACAWDGC